ncbi:tRNA (adenosine(37)-N6)-threonylcarbamoyltransferase complex ATPase subunit type 1 TsaE [Thiohalorhabdus sp.]|uniref:tRNA (adenosine(37)-N6)-threonylcarbamoyltransferase complex ATPase subunit type 1 TsaE n=1 Tax=Thiohalorhabdus sp. TaxID=3094134 RepID=UPI002FC372C7
MAEKVRQVYGEAAQEALGAAIGRHLRPGTVVHLRGEIGVGKTTLTRGMLRGLGITAPVKSPTYTLVEPYQVPRAAVYHFDLYRLGDPEELHFFGAEEYFSSDSICILEWAERAGEALPPPDLVLQAAYRDATSRTVRLEALTDKGRAVLEGLAEDNGDMDGE